MPDLKTISCGYVGIKQTDVTDSLSSAWKNETLPKRQRDLVDYELTQMYKGKVPIVYQTLVDALRPYFQPGFSRQIFHSSRSIL